MIRPALVVAIFLTSSPALADEVLTDITDAARGAFVAVKGEVTRILDEDTFRLTDATGSIRVYIGPNRMPVRDGDSVTVEGQVDDDLIGPREIYADALVLEDGTVVTLSRRYD
jgi:uncharacterized protein YdeI (BOF family)